MSMLRIKQGSTLMLQLSMLDATGAPINLQAATLSAALHTAVGAAVGPIALSATSTPGQAVLLGNASDTATWPIGLLRLDFTVSGSGITTISDTVMLYVEGAP